MADLDAKTLSDLSAKAEQQKQQEKAMKEQQQQSCYVSIIESILQDNALDMTQVATQGGFCHQFSVHRHQLKNVNDLKDFVEFTETYLLKTKGYKKCKIIRTFDVSEIKMLLLICLVVSVIFAFFGCLMLQSHLKPDDSIFDFYIFISTCVFLAFTTMYYCETYQNHATGKLILVSPKKPLSIYLAWR